MWRRVDSRSAFAMLVLAGAACGGSTEPLKACDRPVSVVVTAGTPPTIDWTPACGAEQLRVYQVMPPSFGFLDPPRWIIDADSRLIEPPVTYGRTPHGAIVSLPAEPLEAGWRYRAVVGRMSQVWGGAVFTP